MGTLVCRIELNKQEGITLTVENKDGKITQTAVLGADTITITSKGDKETSTIVQTPDSVTINCKHFLLDSETITCKSSKDTLHDSSGKYDVQSQQNMTLASKAKLSGKADGAVDISGLKIAAAAKNKAELSGASVNISGTSKTDVSGGQLALSGQIKSELKGAIVKVQSDGLLNVEGQMTTIKGKKLNAEGLLTNIG